MIPKALSTAAPCRKLRQERMEQHVAKVVSDNEKLVHWALRRFFRLDEEDAQDYDDYAQVARFAMMKAARGYDPSRGIKFGTYATRAIIREVTTYRLVAYRNGFVSVGDSYQGRACGRVRRFAKMPASLDNMMARNAGGHMDKCDALAVDGEPDDERIDGLECLRVAKEVLDDREYSILVDVVANGHGYHAIAPRFGLSRSRVQQLADLAVRKVQKAMGLPEIEHRRRPYKSRAKA